MQTNPIECLTQIPNPSLQVSSKIHLTWSVTRANPWYQPPRVMKKKHNTPGMSLESESWSPDPMQTTCSRLRSVS